MADRLDFRRIVYSPDVKVYIQTGTDGKQIIDISNDIIEGSITRRTDAVSTAHFLVQSRKKEDNELILRQLRPMDRIVVYLQKVKPILIFSGYLDLVPLFQAVPEPVVIEASCTLKRLEFTYWDPQLPQVQKVLQDYGFLPQASGDGVSYYGRLTEAITASGPRPVSDGIQDTGFGAMLHFLLHDVGGWPTENIWIEPLPQQWIERATMLFQVKNDWDERYDVAKSVVEKLLTTGGSSAGNPTTDTDGGAVTLTEADSIKGAITNNIAQHSRGTPVMTADDFMVPGQKYNIDPRFLAALAAAETAYGTNLDNKSSANVKNCFGYKWVRGEKSTLDGGTYQVFPSFTKCVDYCADVMRNKNYYLKDVPNQTVSQFVVKWSENSQSHADNIKNYWKEMETNGAPVNQNGCYSASAQGIVDQVVSGNNDTSNGGATSGGTRERINATPINVSPTKKDKLTVRLETGHGQPRMPGYNAGDSNEAEANQAIIDEVARLFATSAYSYFSNKIAITYSTTSNPNAWTGDVYISVHHDDSYRDSSQGKVAHPSKFSVRGTMSDNPDDQVGNSGPNLYNNQGTYKKPSEVGGRDVIDTDSGLILNSQTLAESIIKSADSVGSNKFINVADSNNYKSNLDNRAVNYYGFYYVNAAACALIEFPKYDRNSRTKIKQMAKVIADGLINYYETYKKKGLQKPTGGITERTVGDGSTGGAINPGDDTKASKLIKICGQAAQANLDNGWKMQYDTPGVRDKKLSECIRDGDDMDCSGFIYNGFKEIGISESGNTTTLWANKDLLVASREDSQGKRNKFKAGHFFLMGRETGNDQAGHVVLIMNEDGKCVHCTTTDQGSGPQFTTVDKYIDDDRYDLIRHSKIGTTDEPPTGFSDGGSSSSDTTASTADTFLQMKNVAFNMAFNFPGSLLESTTLTGERALENDVKLFESVAEVCQSSMRTFSSLPNGDFIAWYPDYFNLTNRNPWLRISPVEVISCSISLSDRQLVTHVYVIGNPFGTDLQDGGTVRLEWLQKVMGSGVVTIERPWVLDSFLRPFVRQEELVRENKQARPVLDNQTGVSDFLKRYGARPYFEKIPTIRNPILEFFYAYHTFIQKWAEQFISKVELTFMPEMMPGMIVELMMNPAGDDDRGVPKSVTFYVKEVTHNFSFETGFSTQAVLIAPGNTANVDTKVPNDWSLMMVRPPNVETDIYMDQEVAPPADKKKSNERKTRKKRVKKTPRRRTTRRSATPSNRTRAIPSGQTTNEAFPAIESGDING